MIPKMRFHRAISWALALSAGLLVASAGALPRTGPPGLASGAPKVTSCNLTLTAPPQNAVLLKQSTVNIQWTGCSPSWKVNLSLVDVPAWTSLGTFAVNIPNSGSHSWALPASLACNHKYEFYIAEANNVTWTYGPVWTIQCPPPPCPQVSFSFKSRTNSSVVNASLALSNKGPGDATVTMTKMACTAGFKYAPRGGLLQVPFVVPGAKPLHANATTGFNAFFARPGVSQSAPFSCVIGWAGTNGICPGQQTVSIP